jgi:FlaA1/EpsC-like NDP-sugar epimerase
LTETDCDIRMESTVRPSPLARPRGLLRRLGEQVVSPAVLATVLLGAYYAAHWLRFEGQMNDVGMRYFLPTATWVVMIQLVIFGWFRIHRGWRSFVTFYDLLALIQATTIGTLAIAAVDLFFLPRQFIPRSIYLLDWGVIVVGLGGMRTLARMIDERSWRWMFAAGKTPALIVGANVAGEAILRSIIRNGSLVYHVVGFVDNDVARLGSQINGVPVIGTLQQTCRLALPRGVREVLVAAGELSGRQLRVLIDEAGEHGIDVKVLPSYEQLIAGSVALQPRPVAIEDLLRREPVNLDMENIREWIDDRVLLVTGSAGSIGSEICRQLLKFSPKRIVLVDRSETGQFFLERELRAMAGGVDIEPCIADILDETRMRDVLRRHRPDIIFHAAAYKHVPLMEAHPGEAVKNIVTATRRLADLAMRHEVQSFVMISTDKAVHPTSVMGACKRAAEIYVQSLADLSSCRFVTVRFGNVLDSAGSVVQVFREQIRNGGPITVTDPAMTRYFMTIPEAAGLVIQAGAIGKGGEILLLDMGEPVRIVDLAADMIRLSGLRVGEDIEIVFTGVRPGEKLYEELRIVGEKDLPTRHPKITIADRKRRDPASVLDTIERLQAVADMDAALVIEHLQQIVPTFRPTERRNAA